VLPSRIVAAWRLFVRQHVADPDVFSRRRRRSSPVFLSIPERGRNAQMSLHDDECLLAAVAAALGETIALVRSRGFHVDSRSAGYEPTCAGSRCQRDVDDGADALDLVTYGIDWDAGDDSRLRRRTRQLSGRRIRRRVA
jgi:hypothetical protein